MATHHVLRNRYQGAKAKHPDLANISDEQLDELEKENQSEIRRQDAGRHLFIITILPITFFVSIYSGFVAWKWVVQIARYVYDSSFLMMLSSSRPFAAGSLMCFFAVICYFVILPLLTFLPPKFYPPKGRPRHLESKDETNQRRQILREGCRKIWMGAGLVKTLPVIWFFVGWAVVAFAETHRFLLETLIVWMAPLAALVAIGPLFLAGMFVRWRGRQIKKKRATASVSITQRLLQLLSDWPECQVIVSHPDIQKRLASCVSKISKEIRLLYFGNSPNGPSEVWVARQLGLIAENFAVCRSWLYLPKGDSLELVRKRAVEYCNAFLSGSLDSLPRQALSEADGRLREKPRAKRLRMIGFAVVVFGYCALPFGLAFLMKSHVDIPEIPESLWLLGYSLWIVLGLYTHLQQSSDDPRATLVDLLKSFVGR